ncbi:MAG: hypothetical protein ABH804_00745 [archaeon]
MDFNKTRYLCLIIFLLIIISAVATALTLPYGHDASKVNVKVDGNVATLQSALTLNKLVCAGSASPIASLNPGHNAEEILVSVNGIQNTLLAALQLKNGLCPGKSLLSAISSHPPVFHLAGEIQFSSGSTFQQLINSGTFCVVEHATSGCYDNDAYWYDTCGVRNDKKLECGADYCDAWSAPDCVGGNLVQKRTCYHKGCSHGLCYSNSYEDEPKIYQTCEYGCSGPTPHCLARVQKNYVIDTSTVGPALNIDPFGKGTGLGYYLSSYDDLRNPDWANIFCQEIGYQGGTGAYTCGTITSSNCWTEPVSSVTFCECSPEYVKVMHNGEWILYTTNMVSSCSGWGEGVCPANQYIKTATCWKYTYE